MVNTKKKKVGICKKRVRKKITKNIKEYEKGKFVSIKQSIAVAYSQTNKKFPKCRQYLKKK